MLRDKPWLMLPSLNSLASPLKRQRLPEDQHRPVQTRSSLAINGQDLGCCKLPLALLVPTATKAICLAIIKFLLASQLRGRKCAWPCWGLERVWERIPQYSSEMPTQGDQTGLTRWDLIATNTPLPHPFFLHHQTPLPFLQRKLKSWLFQQIPWVPRVVLRPCRSQVASMLLPWNSHNEPFSDKSLGWESKGNFTHTEIHLQPESCT